VFPGKAYKQVREFRVLTVSWSKRMIGVTENDDEIVFLIRKARNNRLNGEM
jgi:hypothetical protein